MVKTSSFKNTIAIVGASGFIGKHLVTKLLQLDGFRIKLLSRNQHLDLYNLAKSDVEVVEGDLLEPDSLQGFLEQGCIVINLVYLREASEAENITAISNLLEACETANVRRLIHMSTADVVGRVLYNLVNENDQCHPVTEYAIKKLKIENTVAAYKSNFNIAILRPTAVFGPEGENLRSLIAGLTNKNWVQNYLKSCLFNKRRMNLVCVGNVVAAIVFLINCNKNFDGEKFIISDDANPANNFSDVERFLMKALNIPYYRFYRFPLPLGFLKLLLACLGRNNINPHCNYSSSKLQSIGFMSPVSFEAGLAEYAEWYKSTQMRKHH